MQVGHLRVSIMSYFGPGNTVAKLPMILRLRAAGIDPDILLDRVNFGLLETLLGDGKYHYYSRGSANAFAIPKAVFTPDILFVTLPSSGQLSFAQFSCKNIRGAWAAPSSWEGLGSEAEANLRLADEFLADGRNSSAASFFPVCKKAGREDAVGFHFGSTGGEWVAKRFPAALWEQILAELPGKKICFGTDSDFYDYAGQEIHYQSVSDCSRFTAPDLSDVVERIQGLSCFVSNDSGLAKIATACGVPTVTLFGPTDPVKNRLNNEVIIRRTDLRCSGSCQYHASLMRHCLNRLCLDISPLNILTEIQRSRTINANSRDKK
jgi:hypothetical protein